MKTEKIMQHHEDEDKQRKLKIKREKNRLRLNKFYFNDAVQDTLKPARDTSQRNENE